MANLKFSQFTEQADPANVQFLVGYNGSDNVRIATSNVADLSAYLPLAGGTMTGDLVIGTNNSLEFEGGGRIRYSTGYMYLRSPSAFLFEVSGYEGIINNTGWGIGTTSPTSKLDVRETIGSGDIMANFTATRAPGSYGPTSVQIDCVDYGNALKIKKTTLGTTAVTFVTETNSQVGYIGIGATSTSYNTTSDYRLKENISPILNGIDRLKQLKPKRFNFIGDTSVVDGFIAHEAKEVVPESVTGEKDEVLPNGDPAYQGIDQGKLVPLLTAALQEAIAKIEFLETRIETLKNA